MRPGVNVSILDTIPARSAPVGVDAFFLIGLAEKGPSAPVLVRDMSSFVQNFGERVAYGDLYDNLDAFFREGGMRAYVMRVVGASAIASSLILEDDTAADTVLVEANSPGDWGDGLNVAVVGTPATSIRIVITNDAGQTLETSPAFTNRADLLSWTDSKFVTLSATGPSTDLPDALAATNLAGGDDDRGSIVASDYIGLLPNFDLALGSGQVAVPGNTTQTVQEALLDHASTFNRVALLDAPDTDVATSLVSAASLLSAHENARYGGMFGPRALIPGYITGTTREMPWTVLQAAMIARLRNPNEPAAGVAGESRLAVAAKHEFTDEDRELMNEAGVNIARPLYGAVRTYGYRTLVNPTDFPEWVQFSTARIVMAIKARADIIGERHMFKQLDGRKITISAFHGELAAMLSGFYEQGALYGSQADEAYSVDTGNQVNTPTSIANGELNANLLVRTSPFGEQVNIWIVKVPLPTSTGPASLAVA